MLYIVLEISDTIFHIPQNQTLSENVMRGGKTESLLFSLKEAL